MTTLIEQLMKKMGLTDEPNVLEKTTELMRLLNLRSTNVPIQINEYGKIVLCVNLATDVLGVPLDKENALKLSGLRKAQFVNNKRMFEKLLDLNKIVDVKDICIKLDLNELIMKSNKLLDFYKKVIASQNSDIDITHPQYAAMAVFQAAKLMKKRVSKTKLMPFSNLKPTQWLQLEQQWDKLIAKHKDVLDNTTVKSTNLGEQPTKEDGVKQNNETNSENCNKSEMVEDYEVWKKRMLALAEQRLKQEAAIEQMEKENVVL